MTDYFDLGRYHRPVAIADADAQMWFDRGLVWCYGFNHEEAAACFQAALDADPTCAMAHWGLAYALGPNYNKPWEAFDAGDLAESVARAHRAVAAARRAAAPGTVEAALADALSARYPRPDPAPDPSAGTAAGAAVGAAGRVDCSTWNADYADAMRDVHRRFPDDPDVAALTADALMNLTPWQLWDQRTGLPAAGAATIEAREILELALAAPGGREHPGLLHFYVHLMEMSAHPEQALWAGDALRDLVPDAGHLRHMPTHLDVLVGDYCGVVRDNTAAVAADEKFRATAGSMNFYTLYRCHDYHFLIYGAMFAGQSAVALDAADRLAASIPEELLAVTQPPMADWLESFCSIRLHVLIRFGRWHQIIDTPLPADPQLYCVTTAMTHYARGVAHAATGDVGAAAAEREAFLAAVTRVPDSRTLFNNTCRDILAVAGAMLDGELEYRRGNVEQAFEHLRRSIELDDTLPYDEPWGWMQPARHAYGALLLEQGRVAEAEAVYRADLGLDATLPRACQHPGNLWSLHGYHECLVRLGKVEAAAIVAQQLQLAGAAADVPVTASCFCRLGTAGSGAAGQRSAGGHGRCAGCDGCDGGCCAHATTGTG